MVSSKNSPANSHFILANVMYIVQPPGVNGQFECVCMTHSELGFDRLLRSNSFIHAKWQEGKKHIHTYPLIPRFTWGSGNNYTLTSIICLIVQSKEVKMKRCNQLWPHSSSNEIELVSSPGRPFTRASIPLNVLACSNNLMFYCCISEFRCGLQQ